MTPDQQRSYYEDRIRATLSEQDPQWLEVASDSAIDALARQVVGDDWDWVIVRAVGGPPQVFLTLYNGAP